MGQRPHRLLGRGEARDDAASAAAGPSAPSQTASTGRAAACAAAAMPTRDLRRPRRQRPHEDGHHRVDRFVIEQDAQRPLGDQQPFGRGPARDRRSALGSAARRRSRTSPPRRRPWPQPPGGSRSSAATCADVSGRSNRSRSRGCMPADSSAGVPAATIRPRPDRDPVGQPLDVGQVVARQEDRRRPRPGAGRGARASPPAPRRPCRRSARRGSTTSGRPTSASASPTRCRSPPDSRRYARPRTRRASPTRPSSSSASRGVGVEPPRGGGDLARPSSADRSRRRPGASARPGPGDRGPPVAGSTRGPGPRPASGRR